MNVIRPFLTNRKDHSVVGWQRDVKAKFWPPEPRGHAEQATVPLMPTLLETYQHGRVIDESLEGWLQGKL